MAELDKPTCSFTLQDLLRTSELGAPLTTVQSLKRCLTAAEDKDTRALTIRALAGGMSRSQCLKAGIKNDMYAAMKIATSKAVKHGDAGLLLTTAEAGGRKRRAHDHEVRRCKCERHV